MTLRQTLTAYLELTKPRIVVLLLLVAFAGYVASVGSALSWPTVFLLLLAGALSSAGSSALNHYLDRDIDGVMVRTRQRPLPTGRLSPAEASAFGLLLVAGGVGVSTLLINPLTGFFIGLGAVFYVIVYTWLLKRRNMWNIVIGGFAGSCPALAGSAAAVNAITLPALLIALLVFLWTPGHFWALSLRNKADYARANVPMLPAVVETRSAVRAIVVSTLLVALYVPLFYLLGTVSLLVLLPALAAAALLVYLTAGVYRDPQAAWTSFKFSGVFLAITLLAITLGAAGGF